jgi:hypothetical protein
MVSIVDLVLLDDDLVQFLLLVLVCLVLVGVVVDVLELSFVVVVEVVVFVLVVVGVVVFVLVVVGVLVLCNTFRCQRCIHLLTVLNCLLVLVELKLNQLGK